MKTHIATTKQMRMSKLIGSILKVKLVFSGLIHLPSKGFSLLTPRFVLSGKESNL